MVKAKNIIKIITIIAIVITLGYTFITLFDFKEPIGTFGIYVVMYFTLVVLITISKLMPDRIVNLNKIKEKVDYNEFQGIYQELLSSHKEELDKYRIQILVKRIIQGILVIIFITIFLAIECGWIVYWDREFALSTPNIALGAAILFFISFFVNIKAETMYRKLYKEKVIGTLIKALGKKLEYSNDVKISASILTAYNKAGFDVAPHNSSEVDDYIAGNLEDELEVAMADLYLTRVSGSGKNKNTVKVFSGMFVDVTTAKDIGATIKILTNRNKKHSKIDFIDNKCEKLEMDSQAFEKRFNVYANNKIIAMQILTSDILEMLTELRDAFGIDLEIVIKNKHIYIRFHTDAMFEAKVFGGSIKKNDVLTYYGVLKMLTIISKRINEIVMNANI